MPKLPTIRSSRGRTNKLIRPEGTSPTKLKRVRPLFLPRFREHRVGKLLPKLRVFFSDLVPISRINFALNPFDPVEKQNRKLLRSKSSAFIDPRKSLADAIFGGVFLVGFLRDH